MKTNNNNPVELLIERVSANFNDIMVNYFMADDKNIMEAENLEHYIKANIDEFLSEEEKFAIISAQISEYDDEEMNSMVLNFAIRMIANRIATSVSILFQSERFAENNPFNPRENPMMFMFCVFSKEKFGVEWKK